MTKADLIIIMKKLDEARTFADMAFASPADGLRFEDYTAKLTYIIEIIAARAGLVELEGIE